jgi:hypothetical protein
MTTVAPKNKTDSHLNCELIIPRKLALHRTCGGATIAEPSGAENAERPAIKYRRQTSLRHLYNET